MTANENNQPADRAPGRWHPDFLHQGDDDLEIALLVAEELLKRNDWDSP